MPIKKAPEAKITAPITEPPASIRALQKLQAALSAEAKTAAKKTKQKIVRPRGHKRPRLCRKQAAAAVRAGHGYYKLQAGLFADKAAAQQLADKLKTGGFAVFIRKAGSRWRVQAGAYRTRKMAEITQQKLQSAGCRAQIIFE